MSSWWRYTTGNGLQVTHGVLGLEKAVLLGQADVVLSDLAELLLAPLPEQPRRDLVVALPLLLVILWWNDGMDGPSVFRSIVTQTQRARLVTYPHRPG
jgi:hypothetical protein